ncbi:DUF2793 domain-containing protein [uncultured Paracoccus sp.]|uniref:DUF2793 domain-containing protein n=1 Tax=uncultured Paracoccus sp. TaxID=189685 RepID=UPI00262CF2A5|nr:DUF2793 domain-containing protein [uncultured Paracoccus sp.]
MADFIPVFDADKVFFDDNGDPVSGGSLTFYEAGTTTARVVYSNPALTAGFSLGNVVQLNSAGRPVSGASIVTIYTGVNAYKYVVKDADGVTLRTHDNQPGAFDTSDLAEDDDVTGLGTGATGVTTVSADTTIATTAEGKLYNVNPSGGSKTMTLPSAVTAGDGWLIGIRHDGSSNSVLIATVSSQTIQHHGTDVTTLALTGNGETAWLQSDGTGWVLSSYVPPIARSNGLHWVVEDQTGTPPGSPTPGQVYIVGAAPSGAWSGFAEHDIAVYAGAGWIKYTPPTDCGWTAYDKDSNTNLQFQASAWVALAGAVGTGLTQTSGTFAVNFADATDMEAATETDEAVVPSLQHRHPGHPKAWISFNGVTTTAILSDYGVSSVTDDGTGKTTISFDTAFSSTNYSWVGSARWHTTTLAGLLTARSVDAKTTTQLSVGTSSSSSVSATDLPEVNLVIMGDQ